MSCNCTNITKGSAIFMGGVQIFAPEKGDPIPPRKPASILEMGVGIPPPRGDVGSRPRWPWANFGGGQGGQDGKSGRRKGYAPFCILTKSGNFVGGRWQVWAVER